MLSLQLHENIRFITIHLCQQDKLGNLLHVALETVQLQSGIDEPVLASRWP